MTAQGSKNWPPDNRHPSPISLEGRVAVLGMGRSGIEMSRFLRARGAEVVAADEKPATELDEEIGRLAEIGVEAIPDIESFDDLGGADLVVTSPGLPLDHHLLAAARGREIPVIGEIELAYRFCEAPIIAVTGTNGKGTTATMIGDMLSAAGTPHRVAGNIGVPFISVVDESADLDVMVIEVSSFQLETVDRFRPWISILLNIAQDHADRHTRADEYQAMKARIFENQRGGDFTILNTDDPRVQSLIDRPPCTVLRVALDDETAHGHVEDTHLAVGLPARLSEAVCKTDEIPVPGDHHITNALCAALAAGLCGASPDDIAQGIRNFTPAEHMLAPAGTVGGVAFVDDSKATNPAAAIADISSLQGPLVVIAGGLGKGVDFSDFGDLLAQRAEHVVLIGESAGQIEKALAGRRPVSKASSMEEAVTVAFEAAEPGWSVVLAPACASFDMFEGQAYRGEAFCESVQRLQSQID